ncbi:MAG: glycerol-3-phosphate acyltransferase [Deltaproteobacteria bacterium]|nr:glycerol-3-phosphate acyltransferase [Deltaproteobacteria bacterium]
MKAFIILFFSAYLAGSVNFSVILFRILGKQDPRKKFSKNPGVTNVYRQTGLPWAAVILFLEMTRAMIIAGAAMGFVKPEYVPWTGFGLILGNSFPCFHRFRGGKGVACYLGFTMIPAPVFSVISAFFWIVSYTLFRTPFIASFFMISVLSAGFIIKFGGSVIPAAGTAATVLFIIFRHRENIGRLIRQEEKK